MFLSIYIFSHFLKRLSEEMDVDVDVGYLRMKCSTSTASAGRYKILMHTKEYQDSMNKCIVLERPTTKLTSKT